MHSNGTLPLDAPLAAPLDARCGYALSVSVSDAKKWVEYLLLVMHRYR